MPDNDDVSLTGDQKEAPGAPAGADKGLGITKEELAILRADNARYEKTNKELMTTSDYWAEQARLGRRSPESAEPIVENDDPDYDENEDSAAFVDDLSTKGIKALEKRGVMTKKATKAMIAEEATKIAREIARDAVGKARTSMTQDAELVSQFPELRDEKSELHVETKKIFATAVAKDPSLKNSPTALMMAAENARNRIAARGGDRATVGDDTEQARQRRIREQSGDGGRRRGEGFAEEDDDSIGPEARNMLSQMSRFGVSDKEYQSERKKIKAGR